MYKRYSFVNGLWNGRLDVEWRGNTFGFGANLRFFHYYGTAHEWTFDFTLGCLHIDGNLQHRG